MRTIGKTLTGCKVVENKNKKLFKISSNSLCGCKWWEAREVKLDTRFKHLKHLTLQDHQGNNAIAESKSQKHLIEQLNKIKG